LSYNTANLYGGGVYVRNSSEIDLRQVFVENNSGSLGGALYASQSPVYLYNVLVARNNATSGTGDGLRLYTGATLTGQHNTLTHNDTGGTATGRAIDLAGATLTLNNSVIWGHASSINAVGQTVTCSDVQGGYTGADNLDVNPLFVSPADANFHLQSLSPVIDRCATGQNVDFDNEARPLTHVRPATAYDMGADEAAPRVGINGAACAYGSLQDAVDAANAGDVIQAAADVFTETVNITKTLTIAGGYDVDCTTYITGTTTVNGAGADSVAEISNGTVTLRDLNLTGGDAGLGGGLGLFGTAQVTLDNTDVFGNQGGNGGGAYVNTYTTLTLTNGSYIHHNTATSNGGGARVWGKLVAADTFSDIDHNSAPNGGGISAPGGTLILRNADMAGNQATGATGKGGGIHVTDSGVVTMTNNAWIYSGNTAYDGAGIYADDAQLYLNYVTVRSNTATNNGGGIYLTNASRLEARLGDIGSAGSGNQAVIGGGMYIDHSTVGFQGNIQANVASANGGGLYANGGTLTLRDTYVGGAGPNAGNRLNASGNGAGLYLSGTHASLVNTHVTSNTFPTVGWGYGGGLYLDNSSVVTLTDSTVSQHSAPGGDMGRGAGLYVFDSTVTLDHSQVISNTTAGVGGGLRLWGVSTLNLLNGSEVRNNHALAGAGGGIAATDTPDINISDSTLQGNTASTDGGAVYLDAGDLDFTGWWDVRDNVAGGNGGAVAVAGTGDADFNATTAGSSLLSNQAGGNGGALYIHNDDTVQLYSTHSYLLSIGGNQAGGNGGAVFGNGANYFDVYGQVIVTANSAGGNGGAFYLTGGKGVWLDDYTNLAPEVRENWARNGGAIYAQSSPNVRCDGAILGDDPTGNQATAGAGGAVYLSGSTLNAENCTFRNNQATGNGGAIAAYTSTLNIRANYSTIILAAERAPLAPQAPQATSCNPLTKECSSFSGNVADSDGTHTSGDYGGAIYVNGSTLQMAHTYLHRNSAWRGGAIYQEGTGGPSATVNNSLFYSNTVASATGAAIRVWNGVFTATHVTLANNTGPAPAYSDDSGATSVVTNSIAWGNETGGFSIDNGAVITECNIDQSGNAGLAVDPQFIAPGAGENYHLLGSSPAIDACVTGLTPDLDNATRPFGSAYDMGAYEYAYGVAFAPDRSGEGLSPSVVMYTHTLTNTGGVADTFTLSATSGNGWSVTFDPAAPVMLNSGQAAPITVSLTIPDGVLSGTLETTLITATSSADPFLTAAVTDTTRTFTSTLPLYTLTVNVEGDGTVTRAPSQTTYISGTVVQLEAFPDTERLFAGWSGDLIGNANPADITLNADAIVTATFTPVPSYTLTVNVVGNGDVTRTPSQTLYLSGTVVTLTATPDVDWIFSEWSGDLLGSATPVTITLDSDKVVTATFAAITHTLAVNTVGSGSVTRSPNQTAYVSGTVVTLAATPAAGWEFSAWSGDLLGSTNPTTITLDTDKTVTATFTAIPTYTLTVNITGTGSVTWTPSQTTYLA
ncbi:MAG TPA: right-handed parallel beta-helix repeat-containing protein, partial [Anaerolineae bacterium]|nr:right-handed parallel beta-helix repeat-containing protein [Anaerolineae bacterium]